MRRLSPVGQAIARAHRPRPGRLFRSADAAAYRPPPGRRRADGYEQALAELHAVVAADTTLRCDGRRTRLLVGQAALAHRYAATELAVVGHARMAAWILQHHGRVVARSTVGNHMRALTEAGWVGVAAHGCSAAIAGRNLAPVYVFLVSDWSPADAADLAAGLARLAGGDVDGHHHAKEGFDVKEVDAAGRIGHGGKRGLAEQRGPGAGRRGRRARNRDDRVAAALDLLGRWALADASAATQRRAEDLAGALSRFFRAGWGADHLEVAVARLPDGTGHWSPVADGRYPVRVVMDRLKAWRQPDGTPVAPPRPPSAPVWADTEPVQPDVVVPLYPPRVRSQAADEAVAALRAALAADRQRRR